MPLPNASPLRSAATVCRVFVRSPRFDKRVTRKDSDMGCNCGSKAKGKINHFSTEDQARIARERGGVVITTAKSAQKATAPAAQN